MRHVLTTKTYENRTFGKLNWLHSKDALSLPTCEYYITIQFCGSICHLQPIPSISRSEVKTWSRTNGDYTFDCISSGPNDAYIEFVAR